jgi:hypothetical protein
LEILSLWSSGSPDPLIAVERLLVVEKFSEGQETLVSGGYGKYIISESELVGAAGLLTR